jgi:hypothetical protein
MVSLKRAVKRSEHDIDARNAVAIVFRRLGRRDVHA